MNTGAATRVECRAKVNLRLRVFGRDESGYHAVETLLLRTDLSDVLELEPADDGISLEVTGAAADEVPAGAENLCHRAAAAFLQAAFQGRGARPGIRLRLEKRIPAGTGLGGGSADAAGALRLLARAWPRLDDRALVAIAGRLGSDVPFGLLDVPMALAWERGRRLLPLRGPRPRPGLLVCPPFRVPTAEAYGWIDASRASGPPTEGAAVLPGPARLAGWETLGRLVVNDFEAPVVARYPELGVALRTLRETAPLAAMTGSGPALFAVFDDDEGRARAREALLGAGTGAGEGWLALDATLPS